MNNPRMRIFAVYMILQTAGMHILVSCKDSHDNIDSHGLGFPFQLKDDERAEVGERSLRSINVILPQEHYSQPNLDRLFRFYSDKYAGEKWMAIRVYTDEGKYGEWQRKRELEKLFEGVPDPGLAPPDAAHFVREEGKEYYEYSPDPEKRLEVERVVLREKG